MPMNPPAHHISICICTYKRPRSLERLLTSLERQRTDGEFAISAVVVDNDDRESGREVVAAARARSPVEVQYHAEPQRSISLARNRSVANARGDLIAFIDDDEFPDDSWLLNHFRFLSSSGADGVLGPVIPHFDDQAPAWLVKSGLLDRKRFPTGEVIADTRYMRTGNALVRRSLFTEAGGSFDPQYGLSGGGDAVFFKRMTEQGKVFLWCNEACVYETVLPERWRKSYYVRRAFTRGMAEAWETPLFSRSTVRSLAAVVVYTLALPFCFLLGQHRFMPCLVRGCDHLGKILAYCGIRVVSKRPY